MNNLPKQMNVGPAPRKLRIALVYSRLPFPMMRGDQKTVAHLISFLAARGHDVDLFTLDVDGALGEHERHWLNEVCRSVDIFSHGILAKARGLLRACITGEPFRNAVFRSHKLNRRLTARIAEGVYDLIYCYYPRSAEAVLVASAGTSVPRILGLQLSQTLNTERMAENERNWLRRFVYRTEAFRTARFESEIWRRFDRVGLIGDKDVAAINHCCATHHRPPIDNWFYSPHGTDTEAFRVADRSEIVEGRVVFSGSMLYPPNVQAVLWFARHVWPTILGKFPEAEFVVQGRDPAPEVLALKEQPGITVTGTVADVGDLIRSAHVCINPMLAAGGMQNKLIEYMASGKAIVATSVANEGIGAPDDVLRTADNPERFVEIIEQLFRDLEGAHALGLRARRYAEASWTWEAHFLNLEREFLSLVS